MHATYKRILSMFTIIYHLYQKKYKPTIFFLKIKEISNLLSRQSICKTYGIKFKAIKVKEKYRSDILLQKSQFFKLSKRQSFLNKSMTKYLEKKINSRKKIIKTHRLSTNQKLRYKQIKLKFQILISNVICRIYGIKWKIHKIQY